MRATFAPLVFAALAVASPAPQAVTSAIAPPSAPPPGCSENYDGTFVLGPVNVTNTKRDLDGALDERNTQLGITLKGGILTDPQGRTGYIASNQQFQFDGPPQAGAIWTAGFSVCQNGSMALGGDVFWYKCLSGGFYNLYFESIGGQCIQSYLVTRPLGGSGGPAPVSNTPSAPTSSATTSAAPSSSPPSNSTMAPSTSSSMMMSSSSSAPATTTSTTATTVVGGGHHSPTVASPRSSTTAPPPGSTSPAAASSSSTVSPGAAVATLKADIFGLAAGMLAMAVL